MAHLTEERFNYLSSKPIELITPEELIELNSIQSSRPTGYVSIHNALRAVEFARNEDLSETERKVIRRHGFKKSNNFKS